MRLRCSCTHGRELHAKGKCEVEGCFCSFFAADPLYPEEPPKPRLPTKVKIGWRDYKISALSPTLSAQEQRYGDTRHLLNEIRVQVDGCNLRQTAHTLLHEIMHGVCYMFNVTVEVPKDEREEHLVTTMSDGLSQVFRDNPDVAAFIQHGLVHGGDPEVQ